MTKRSLVLLPVLLGLLLTACDNSQPTQPPTVTVASPYADKLDLVAVGELIKANQATTGPILEQRINDPAINQVNLDGDEAMDFLTVRSWGNQHGRGFKIQDDLGGGDVRPIATITMNEQFGNVNVQVIGDPALYSASHAHYFNRPSQDFMMMAWVLSNPSYVSTYRYGSYPSYYTRPQVVRRVIRTETIRREVPVQPSNVTPAQNGRQFGSNGSQQTQSNAPQRQFTPPPAPPRQVNDTRSLDSGFKVRDTSKPINASGFDKPRQSAPSVPAPAPKPSVAPAPQAPRYTPAPTPPRSLSDSNSSFGKRK